MPAGQHPRASLTPEGWLLRLGSSSNHCGRGGDSVLRDGCSELAVQPLPLPLPSTTDLEPIARRVADAAGLAVVGVQLHTHRIPITVQVQVRRADGSDVNLDDCAALTAPLGEALEASALLEGAYVLEVSSPGIGDDLQTDRDFVSFRGFPVAVERRGAEGSSSILEGLLLGRDGDTVHLNMRGRPVRVPRQEVVRVHLVSPRDGP